MRRRNLLFSSLIIASMLAAAAVPVKSQSAAAVLAAEGQKLTAGRNVNMVAGQTLPNGDPWLQRQNEPSLAVSTQSILHLLGGSNDYRTVDIPLENENLPGFQGPLSAAPDAWLGLYKSVDGGQSWASTLLPGFPQDGSAAGLASPLKFNPALRTGFTAAADPVVRSGPAGMFYYSGIAFNRTKITGWNNSALFVARFVDRNNVEAGDPAVTEPIQYIDTTILATDGRLSNTFIDKPWIAADAPKAGAKSIQIGSQMVPRHNVYVAYSLFTEDATTQSSSIYVITSPDCGKSWGRPMLVNQGGGLQQGATIAIDPRAGGNVYVAWRRFDAKKYVNAIMIARSVDKGATFQSSKVVTQFTTGLGPFDQPSTAVDSAYGGGFRTNSYPAMAVDDKGVVYLAWSQRGRGQNAAARIMLATSRDGVTWSQPAVIDNPSDKLGHQFMPSLAFAAGKLTVAWYDQREDYCANFVGFGDWIIDNLPFRHTIDVRAAQADTADFPNLKWKTVQVSRYQYTLEPDADRRGKYKAFQAQWNPPNYPLFAAAKQPFHGDYLDVAASVPFVRGSDGLWRFNTAVADNPIFHVAWTDNRDVRPPSNGNWTSYAAPWSPENAAWASGGRPNCVGGQQPGMRNQNVYTAQLAMGIAAGSPANAKALDLRVPRAFAVFVKNNTTSLRSFRLTIDAQPTGGSASFLQFERLDYLDVSIAPYSAISRQVFVSSTNVKASVLVRIEEIEEPGGPPLGGGLTGSVLLNGDPTSVGVGGTQETHQPEIDMPHIRNWAANALSVNPEVDDEDLVNTDIVNPNIIPSGDSDPAVVNPNLVPPILFNPHSRNTDYLTPSIVNPHIRNPHIRNESPSDVSVTDVEWPVKNAGNTASSFSFTLLAKEALPEGLYAQLIVYKVHYTPAVAGDIVQNGMHLDGCELRKEPHHEILLNIVNPDIVNPHIRNPNLLNPHIRNSDIENATFILGPGEEAVVNLRIIESHEEKQAASATMLVGGFDLPVDIGSFIQSVGAAVTAQSVDSADAAQGIEQPKTDATLLVITTTALPPGRIGQAYPPQPYLMTDAQLTAAGGSGAYSWWANPNDLPPGLVFSSATGQIAGQPLLVTGKTYPAVYSFTVQVSDTSSPPQTASQRFSIVVEDPYQPLPTLAITTPSPLPPGTEGKAYGVALGAVGGAWPYSWTRTSGDLPPGLFIDEAGAIGGTPTSAGTYAFTVRVADSDTRVPHAAEKTFNITIQRADAVTYTISGIVTLAGSGTRLPDVLMQGLPSAPSTDASGSYTDTVPAGWSGTVTPFKAGYYFVPASTSYTNVQAHRLSQNYVAYPVVLHHFDVSAVGPVTAGLPFALTITARDDQNRVVTTYGDANILGDTTGSITPKMTGSFARGVWSGQVTIMTVATGAVITTTGGGRTGQSNAFDVRIGAASTVRVDTAPGGTGTEVLTRTLGPGQVLTVFAASHDRGGNFTGDAPVTWSLTGATGGVVAGDLVPSPDGRSAVFTAHAAGTCLIKAESPTLGSDMTGTITVMATLADDAYENNDDRVNAAPLGLGTTSNLVLMDPDWYRITVPPADAGKDLMIHLQGISYPDPTTRHDLDMIVFDSLGRMWAYNISGGDNEYAFIPGAAAGDYEIGLIYIPVEGVVYSLTVETGTNFGIGYIEGRVVGPSGNGLQNVLVELYGEPFNWDSSRPMSTTDGNGHYRIGFFPGRYTVRLNLYNPDMAQDPQMGDPNYIGKTYNDNEVVTIQAGATRTGIDAALEPGGAIWGRVTDGAGNGLSLAAVGVHAADGSRVAAVFTDVLGQYQADRIPSGNFKVRARQAAQLGYEWYGGAPSLASGQPVRVTAGLVTSGIDIDLEEDAGHIQGRVTDNLGNPIAGVAVTAFDEAGINVSAATTGGSGTYDIPRLSTGQVRIQFNPVNTTGNYYPKYFPNEDLLATAVPVPVTSGQVTPNIDAQLSAAGTITGRVTDSTGNGVPGVTVRVFDTNSDRYYGATTDGAGAYTVAHIRPDDYKVLFRPETGTAAAEWYDNWSSSIGAKVVTVAPNGTLTDVNAQLSDQSASISGLVGGAGPLANVTVLAFDSSRGARSSFISAAVTAADGTYHLKRLPGAEYKVYYNADAAFFGYASEYYLAKGSFAEADPIIVPANQDYPNISTILTARPQLAISTATLPDGRQGQLYSVSLTATGGRPFYQWTLDYGTLPNGLTLSANGELRGIPMASGIYTFTVRVTDSTRINWHDTQSATRSYTLNVAAYAGGSYIVSGTIQAGGLPLPGIVLDGLPGPPVTNASGQYSVSVASGWSGVVTPTLAGRTFDPPNRTYTNVTASWTAQNFTASAGWTISGTVTFNGAPLPGVLLSGLPGDPRTNTSGFYRASVPQGWSGTVIPTAPGFAFSPSNRPYTSVSGDRTAQDFTAAFAGGVDDPYEGNNTFETSAVITPGTYTDLVLNDADWYKLYVPMTEAGKILRIHVKGVSYPDASSRHDLDFYVIGPNGKPVSYNLSGGDDEYAFIPDLGEGWYAIGLVYLPGQGVVYSLAADLGIDFGIGFIEGRVTDAQGRGLEGSYIELYGQPFNWDTTRPMAFTDATGHYKISFLPGEYQVLFNVQDFMHRDPWVADLNYVGKTYGRSFNLVAGSAYTGIDTSLLRGGAISGHLAAAAGTPLRGTVRVISGNGMADGIGYVDTNSNYLVERLPEGNYKVLFIPTTSGNYAAEWYDGSGSFEASAPIPVTAGQATTGIDFHVGPQGSIEGTVTDTSGAPLAGISVTWFDAADPYLGLSVAFTDANGHYLLGRLPNGSVKLRFAASNVAMNYAPEFYPDALLFPDAAAINVQSGQTVSGINVQLAAAGSINGRVTDSTGRGLYGVTVVCEDIETPRTYGATTSLDGYYTVTDVLPDVYRVRFVAGYGNLAARYFNDREDATRADLITVHAGETLGAINAQLRADGGFLTGRLLDGGGRPIEGIVVSALDGLSTAPLAQATTTPDGTFTVQGLPTSSMRVNFNTHSNWLGVSSEFYSHKPNFGTADPVTTQRTSTTPLSDIVLSSTAAPAITTTALPSGELGVPYSAAVVATGGRPLYYFRVESGSVPHGLTLNGNGELRGLPTSVGIFVFSVRVTDSTRPQQSASRSFSVTIGAFTGPGHIVSGRIMAAGTIPVPGVTLVGLPGSPVTNAFGEYVAAVMTGWSATVTPTRAGYAFDPPVRAYANVGAAFPSQDYAASPGYPITGTVTLNGTPLPGVLMAGLPGEPRTNTSGVYAAAVPSGWSGTVTPNAPGFTFNPPSRPYTPVTAAQTAQDYTAVFAGGAEDPFESNNDFASARGIPLGTQSNLVLNNEDWFRVYVPAGDAGKDLKIHTQALVSPNPTAYQDIDFVVYDASHRLLATTCSSSDNETAYVSGLTEGWYYVGIYLFPQPGTVYSLTMETGNTFGIGYVSGRVTDPQGHALENVYIELQQEAFNWGVSWPIVLTDANGNFRAGYAPGRYRILYNSNNIPGFNNPWAPNADYVGTSSETLVALSTGATMPGNDAQLAPAGSISGRLTDHGGNLIRSTEALVYAHSAANSVASYGWTAADGTYRISHLPPGNYKVRFRSMTGAYSYEWYNDTSTIEDGLPVPVQAGIITTDVNAVLDNWTDVQGFIQGHVTDHNGNPLNGVGVTAIDSAGNAVVSGNTGWTGSGNYTIAGLRPGFYKVYFNPQPGNAAEYHPDRLLMTEAVPVQVQTGQTVTGIDAQLAAAGSISGRVTDGSGSGIYGITVSAMDVETDRVYSATTNATGNYTITRVLPDVYRVRFRPEIGAWATEWFDGSADFAAADAVTVSAGQAVANISVRLEEDGGLITGLVTGPSGAPAWGVRVAARDSVKGVQIAQGYTNPSGQYTIRRLPTGQAKVTFDADTSFLAVSSEHFNDKTAFAAADPVATTRGGTTSDINAMLAPIPSLAITTASLPDGRQFDPYSTVLQAQGGRPFYYWSLAPGSDPLPAGLSLTGKGEILGTPLAAGTYNLAISVTDSTKPQQSQTMPLALNVAQSGGHGYTIDGYIWLNSAWGTPLPGVVLEGLPGPPATNLQGFYTTVVPAGFTGTSRPVLSGYGFNPETDGYTDIHVNRPRQDYIAYVVTLAETTDHLPNGTAGQPYYQQLGATGGTPPYSWSLFAGTLPDGLTLAADGTISGTPARTGNYEFTARVMDSGSPTQRVNRVFNVTIGPGSVSEAILYSSNASGSFDLWAMGADGSNKQNLSLIGHDPSGLCTEYSGRWSPDGTRIAFTSNKAGCQGVWIMDADGRNDFKLTPSPYQELECAWSPDGTKIYFSRNTSTTDNSGCAGCSNLDIYAYDLPSQTETRLTNNSYREMCTTVSPDGTRIAWAKDESSGGCCGLTDIWIMNSNGTGQTLLSGQPGAYDFGPIWGKADNRVYFSRHNASTDYDVYSVNPDGTGLARLTDNSYYDTIQAVSPDGSRILFKSNRNGQSDVWIMDPSGHVLGQLTNDAAEEYYGDWTSSRGVPAFTETFESSTVGNVPNGWTVANGGAAIATSNTRAQEGSQSLYIRGVPYGGANLDRYVSALGISSGIYQLTFFMSADTTAWTGTDGLAVGHLQIQGYSYGMGIKKNGGSYELIMYGVTDKTVPFPGAVEAWNRYDLLINLDTHTTDFYLNGVRIDSNNAYSFSAPDRIQLAAGSSGPGGGTPTVFYDRVTVVRIR